MSKQNKQKGCVKMTENKNSKNNCLPLSFEPLFYGAGSVCANKRVAFAMSLSDINARDNSFLGKTMAMYAAECGDKALIKYCHEHDADFNIQNNDGWTALMYAVANDQEDIVSYLLDNVKNIDLKKQSVQGNDVFYFATYSTDKIRNMLYSFLYNRQIKGSAAKKQKDANVKTK